MQTNRAWWWMLAIVPAAAFTFQSATTLLVSRQGLLTTAVDVADFNRDGIADVVSANLPRFGSGGSTISVLLGVRGSVGTGSLTELPATGTPLQVIAADFTNDGVPDIVALSLLDNVGTDRGRVCVYPGNSFGGFGFPNCSTVPGSPTRMAAGDFNRDGQPDLIVVRTTDSAVSVMQNAGNGLFAATPSISVQLPSAVAVADFNGDGIQDAAVVSQPGLLTLLISSAPSALQTQQTWSIAAGPSDLLITDLNRDGRPDVVIAHSGSNTLTTGLGQANTQAALQPLRLWPLFVSPFAMRAADLNGDQAAEIVVSTAAGIVVVAPQGDGTLLPPTLPGAAPISQRPVGVGDINGDGRLDVVAISVDGGAAGPVALLGQATATVTRMELAAATVPYGQAVGITVRVQLAQAGPTALPLTGAAVQILDSGRELQRVTLTAGSGGTDLATGRFEVVLPAGERQISARFVGTAAYLGSTSEVARVTVQPLQSTVRFQTGPAEVSYTLGLRVNAVVRGPVQAASEGIVKLSVNGNVVAQGLVTAGISQMFIPPGMPLGRIKVRLSYEGPNFLPSASDEVEYVVKGGTATAASAASYRQTVAPDSFAVLSVPGLERKEGAVAGEVPWPKVLGGVEVEVRDTAGTARQRAGVTYAGTGQVNIQVPPESALGFRQVAVIIDGVEAATGELLVASVAPGLFTADGSGGGAPAAYAALYGSDGTVTDQAVFQCGGGRCAPAPLDLGGAGDSLILTIFGTGWRGAKSVTATIDGRAAEILFSGAQPSAPGLDQANIRVPKELAGRGEVSLVVTADGVIANGTRILIR